MNIPSISKNSFRDREYIFWGSLPLSRKLFLAFGILFALAMISAIITLFGSSRTQIAYRDALTQGFELRNSQSYTELQERSEREALIDSISQNDQDTTTIENALQVALRELGRATGTQTSVRLKTVVVHEDHTTPMLVHEKES